MRDSKSIPERTRDECGAEKEPLPPVAWAKLNHAQRADILAHVSGLTCDPGTYDAPAGGWTCFHCGETFKTYDGARLHFGGTVTQPALCTAEAIRNAIKGNVQLVWSGRTGYSFSEPSLDLAVRAILKASDVAAAPVEASPRQVMPPIRDDQP